MNYPNGRKYTSIETPPTQAKKSKYGAVKTKVDGIVFDSKKESNRYAELKVLEQAGVITNLRLQVPFELMPKSKYGMAIRYYADFVYYENNKLIVEDAKGMRTPMYKIKKRLMAEVHGIEIKET